MSVHACLFVCWSESVSLSVDLYIYLSLSVFSLTEPDGWRKTLSPPDPDPDPVYLSASFYIWLLTVCVLIWVCLSVVFESSLYPSSLSNLTSHLSGVTSTLYYQSVVTTEMDPSNAQKDIPYGYYSSISEFQKVWCFLTHLVPNTACFNVYFSGFIYLAICLSLWFYVCTSVYL